MHIPEITVKTHAEGISAEAAVERLKAGNAAFLTAEHAIGDASPALRSKLSTHGQEPFAIVVTCSDSRVIPEAIFSVDLGDLFVIRVAGNVMDDHQLGSIEYAAGHLGVNLVVVLGHTHCGAVDAAINHDPEGYIKFITDEIKAAIGDETDDYKACVLNVKRGMDIIESSLDIQHEEELGLHVVGAVYNLETGAVDWLPEDRCPHCGL